MTIPACLPRQPHLTIFSITVLCACMTLAVQPARAQVLTTLHNFTGGADGAFPIGGLTLGPAGHLYGTSVSGGNLTGECLDLGGCGGVFRLTRSAGGWTLVPLFSFSPLFGAGATPYAPVTMAPDETLYGTTSMGGSPACSFGCGTVFHLTPPSSPCLTALCPWTETVIYDFQSVADGYMPFGPVTLDAAGNIYGTTTEGGANSAGSVFKLTRSGGGWTKTTLHDFVGAGDGARPQAGVIFDAAGNLYGTATEGGDLSCGSGIGCGTVYELSPSPSGWTETTLYTFEMNSVGISPRAGVIFDSAGNLYGAASGGAMGSGTVYELQPSNGGWTATVLQAFSGTGGPGASLTMDAAGNLYGTTAGSGDHFRGSVFKLTKNGSGWLFSTLHSFADDDGGGYNPADSVVLDASGNVYGTTTWGGTGNCPTHGCGVAFEITQ